MKKTPSVFVRGAKGLATREVTPGSEWVLAGAGRATVKLDGTACMVRGGALFKRYDAKGGATPPLSFEPCEELADASGHWPGWLPVGEGPEDRWHREAAWLSLMPGVADGTYELIGPKIQSNPYGLDHHELRRHGESTCPIDEHWPRTFDAFRSYLQRVQIEGIVFHHPDGRMAKVKRRDFSIEWPPKEWKK